MGAKAILALAIIIIVLLGQTPQLVNATQIKTVEYMLGMDNPGADTARASAATITVSNYTLIYLPEDYVKVDSAWIESYGATASSADITAAKIIFNGITYNPVTSLYGDTSGEEYSFYLLTNVTNASWAFVTPMQANMSISITGPTWSASSSKLFITYEYNDSSPTQLNTVRFPFDKIWGNTTGLANNVKYNYNATIAEHNTSTMVQKAWFEIMGFQDGIQTADGNLKANVQSDSATTYAFYETGLASAYDALFLFNATSGTSFLLNSQQTLTVTEADSAVFREVGGELAVTYNFSSSSEMRTKTISYFMGQGVTRDLTTTASYAREIKIPENNVTIQAVWVRVYGGFATTTIGNITMAGRVDGTAVQTRTTSIDVSFIGGFQPIIYNMSSAAGSLVNGSTAEVNVTYTQASNTPAGVQLFITYWYNSSSPEQIKTLRYFAGQSPGQSGKHNFTQNVYVLENSPTLQSGYLDMTRSSTTAADPVLHSGINNSSALAVQQESAEIQFHKMLNNDTQNILTATNNSYNVTINSTTNQVGYAMIVMTYNFSAAALTCILSLNETTVNFTQNSNSQLQPGATTDNITIQVSNTGNIDANILIKGTDFEGPVVLGVNNTSFAGGDSFTFAALTPNDQTHKTALGGGSSFDSYLRANIPASQKPGAYNQNMTYSISC